MSNGCTHITAQNYDPNATAWDHSCQYLLKVSLTPVFTSTPETFCLLFEDITDYEDRSFTISWSVKSQSWVFFHDYIPDFYFHTREKLFNSKEGTKLYEHHAGKPGTYHDEDPHPFFIDVVFRSDVDILLETVEWISSVVSDTSDASSRASEWGTLTHISVWNSQQHTGRIALQDVFASLQYDTSRMTDGRWSFNDFRNVVTERGTQFIQTLFEDYQLDANLTEDKPWYDAELMQDKYMIVRFEFDNGQGQDPSLYEGKQLILHDTSITAIKAKR